MSDKRYYVRVRGKVLGPFGVPQLRALRDRGQFSSFHEISEDRRSWASAADLDDLFASQGRRAGDAASETAGTGSGPPSSPAEQWRYVGPDGREHGPVSRAGLLTLRQNQAIGDTTLVWRAGLPDWTPLADAGIAPPDKQGPAGQRLSGFDALPMFLSDPVGNLPRLCTDLRALTAFWLGIGFYCIAVVGAFLGVVLYLQLVDVPEVRDFPAFRRPTVRVEVLPYIMRLLALIAIPLVSLTGSLSLARLVTRSHGNFGADTLIAGATWLPIGLAMPIFALLGANYELVFFLALVLNVLQILLLNSALTRAMRLPDRGVIFAIPAVLVVTAYLCKVIFVALFGPLPFAVP